MDDQNEPADLDRGDATDAFGPDLELVAQLVASGESHAQSGLAVGRSAKFVQRAFRDNPAFAERVRTIQEERAAQAAAGLSSLLPDSVDATRRALECGSTPDELRAASMVFKEFHAYRAESAAAQRVAELQAQIDELRQLVEGTGEAAAGAQR